MTEWQPIETAPKDGRDALIACADGYIAIGWWSDLPNLCKLRIPKSIVTGKQIGRAHV